MTLRPVSMDFNYGSSFGERSPSAYETLLLDAMVGDATLYTRQDMVEASWAVVQPILDYRERHPFEFPQLRGGHLGTGSAPTKCSRAAATRGGIRNGSRGPPGTHLERAAQALGRSRQRGSDTVCCAPAP